MFDSQTQYSEEPKHQSSQVEDELSRKFSTAVFDDPKTFITVLRDNFHKIPKTIPGVVTKSDLVAHAQTSTDDSGKAAAIAARYFDELRQVSHIQPTVGRDPIYYVDKIKQDTLSRRDLQTALTLNYGSTNFYIAKRIGSGVLATTALGLSTAMSAAITVMSAEFPPLAVLQGGLTIAIAGLTGQAAYNTYSYRSQIKELSKQNKMVLSSWPEINSTPKKAS